MRNAQIIRNTAETKIRLTLELDGTGKSEIATGVGFLDHMLTLFAKHGRFDLTVSCDGDTWVDDHHTTEDVGIALGQAFRQALGDKKGITRYGNMVLPMDEALILTAVDLSGRGYLGYDLQIPAQNAISFSMIACFRTAGNLQKAFLRCIWGNPMSCLTASKPAIFS